MSPQIASRLRNAFASALAALFALCLMALWIGGLNNFPQIVSGFLRLFLIISCAGFVLGAFLKTARIRWSLLLGTLSGLAGGTAIVLHAMSQI